MDNTPNTQLPQISEILNSGSWKIKNDDDLCVMAQSIIDKCPQNPKELHSCVEKYIVDGNKFNKGLKKICAGVHKKLSDAGLIGGKKEKPKVQEIEDTPSTQFEDSESNSTPMREKSPEESKTTEQKYGHEEGDVVKDKWLAKKEAQFAARQYEEKAAVERQIDEMLATKEAIPKPTVMHDKSELYAADLFLPGVTITAGNKLLIEEATLKFTKGRKYGLVGRNGTGKTTLINSICRKELDLMPQNLHILQVEQEVPGDDMTILEHVLECDTERTRLMKEAEDIPKIDTSNMPEDEKMELEEKLKDVNEMLDLIDANEAPTKATLILIGLGFT